MEVRRDTMGAFVSWSIRHNACLPSGSGTGPPPPPGTGTQIQHWNCKHCWQWELTKENKLIASLFHAVQQGWDHRVMTPAPWLLLNNLRHVSGSMLLFSWLIILFCKDLSCHFSSESLPSSAKGTQAWQLLIPKRIKKCFEKLVFMPLILPGEAHT